jgi:hypothetical protein
VKYLRPTLQVALLGAAAFAVWYFLFPSPEKVIEKKIQALAGVISENPPGNISKVANVNRIGSFFHPNVSIHLEGFRREVSSVQGRGELEQMAMGVRQNNFAISIHFSNIHIAVGPDKTNATVLLTAEVKLADQTEPVVQDIRMAFEKAGRAWLIRSATPAKVLKIE